jgi:hypothetical protein
MNLKSIYLGENYNAYLQGVEVESTYNAVNHKIEPGQHIMVFKDTPAARPSIPVPADQESQSIGIEGMITQVNRVTDLKKGDTVQHIKLKRV